MPVISSVEGVREEEDVSAKSSFEELERAVNKRSSEKRPPAAGASP